MAKPIASTTNRIVTLGIGVPGIFDFARSVQNSVKSVTAVVPSSPTASPRKSASVPIVTASDGRPTTVMKKPLTAPAIAPTTMLTRPATSIGSPAWCSVPMTTLDSPTMLATDRSISPVMMMSVIGRAMSRIGATSSSR